MPGTPPPDDDAALRWDDVDDPSWVDAESTGRRTRGELDALELDSVEHGGHRDASDGRAGAPRAGTGGLALVTAAGAVVYLAYSVGWILGVGTLPLSGPTLVLEVLYQFAEFLAIVSSALWFGTTIVLTRGRLACRAGWLALGTLVLLPWPVVLWALA